MLYAYISIKWHIRHHNAHILWSNVAIIIEIIHFECKVDFGFKIPKEYLDEVADKALLGDEVLLFLVLKFLFGGATQMLSGLEIRKHIVKPVIDYAW